MIIQLLDNYQNFRSVDEMAEFTHGLIKDILPSSHMRLVYSDHSILNSAKIIEFSTSDHLKYREKSAYLEERDILSLTSNLEHLIFFDKLKKPLKSEIGRYYSEMNYSSFIISPICASNIPYGYLLIWKNHNEDVITATDSDLEMIAQLSSLLGLILSSAFNTENSIIAGNSFNLIHRQSPDIMVMMGENMEIKEISAGIEELSGRKQESYIGKKLSDVFDQASDQETPHQLQISNPDGGISYVDVRTWADKTNQGEPIEFAIIRDVTTKTEQDLKRALEEKINSLGVLAGGIAHDFNNYLASLLGNISVLDTLLQGHSPKVTRVLKSMETAAINATSLTNQLLTFAKGGKPKNEIVEIVKLVNDTLNFVLADKEVAYNPLENFKMYVSGDPGLLGRVISNIAINAVEALQESNTRDPSITTEISEREGWIKISIEDNDGGIPPHIIDKIFDPYFTTKKQGSGLGLATSHSIIKNHGGSLEVESMPNRTVFIITLPAARGDNSPSTSQKSTPLKITLIDDDILVLEALSNLLEIEGHEVSTFLSPEKLISSFQKAEEDEIFIIDLSITRGWNGARVLEELKKKDPDIRAIVMSGYSDDNILTNYEKYGFKGSIIKPATKHDILKEIVRVHNL